MEDLKINPSLRFSDFNSNWIIKNYEDIYSFFPTNSFSRDKLNYSDGNVYNIHYGDIHTKFSALFDLTKELVPFVNPEIDLSKWSEERYCVEGDLVIADVSEDYGGVGKTIEIINLDDKRVLAGLHTFHARPSKNTIAIGFSGYLLQSWKVRKQKMIIAQGTKGLALSYKTLGKIKFRVSSMI